MTDHRLFILILLLGLALDAITGWAWSAAIFGG